MQTSIPQEAFKAVEMAMADAERLKSARNCAMQWANQACMLKLIVIEAREYVDAYIKQCDVKQGIQGAGQFLRYIDDVLGENQKGTA